MRQTIDLTEFRDFESVDTCPKPWFFKKGTLKLSHRRLLTGLAPRPFLGLLPWTEKEQPLTRDQEIRQSYFPVGDRKTIKREKEWQLYQNGKSCECCGKDMSRKPWNMIYLLCAPCHDRLDDTVEQKLNLF